MQLSFPFETVDLRKRPYRDDPTMQMPYVGKSPNRRRTVGLPIGTQSSFIAAAGTAERLNTPLNTLLTIRWRSLFCDNDVNPLRPLPTPERIKHIVEHLRKWLDRHSAASFYIWVRENADRAGEHWHIAFHLRKKMQTQLKRFVASLTGETPGPRIPSEATEGEFARGELGSWHLACDTHPDRGGIFLAAYLGKGEPSQRLFRGKLVDNERKPFRGMRYGGSFENGVYDIDQGGIEGTASRNDRFFITNKLKPKKSSVQEVKKERSIA